MEQQISIPAKRAYDFNLEHFRIRLTARFGIILACLIIMLPRLIGITADPKLPAYTKMFFAISLPFLLLMVLTILFEYFLYKRIGARIVKYSGLVDILLLLFFMTDWILILIASLSRLQPSVNFQIKALFGFVGFSGRTMMVTLIVQKWQLKIIPPSVAIILTTGYVISYSKGDILFILLSAICQLTNIILIIYFEDKVKWKMVWANIQKDKWMQVNNFILNSLPENIMILDLNGEVKFTSEYCQSFMKKYHLSLDPTKEFFKNIQDLQLQPQQSELEMQSPTVSTLQVERFVTVNGLLTDNEENNPPRNQVLEDILINVEKNIKNKEMQEKQFLVYNGKLKIENQKERSLEVKISFVQHFENYHIILIIRDTTQRDLLVTLEETNRYKDELLASVSHELRAPLNGNINLVESAVQSKKIPEKVKESLLIPALRSSKFLLHIINDILDMSQIKEKKLRLVFQSENLKETLKSTAQLVELQAKKKGIGLLVDIDSNLPSKFCTDHIRLSQIILNLLNNAIKFTKQGQVKVTAKVMPEVNWVKIYVEDSGIGMSQENVQKLFSSYTHIEFEGRQKMNPAGVGLGLNIAYNLALLLGPQDHQGISVTSFPQQGSTFTFILENKQKTPLEFQDESSRDLCEVAEESPRISNKKIFQKISSDVFHSIGPIAGKSEPLTLPNNSCSCPKVLIVDDNPFNTMACETILGSLEVKCDSVYSGACCINNLLNRQVKVCGENCKQYAIVFMDQEMPEMSGSETVKEIRRLQNQNLLSKDIKLIGCTAHKSNEEIERFMEAGIDQCIHKPISTVMIKDIMNETL